MSIPSWCFVGAHIICIDDHIEDSDPSDPVAVPAKGEIVTITRVKWDNQWRRYGLWLQEYPEGLYDIFHFRPLITRSQSEDVALFRSLLQPERADA